MNWKMGLLRARPPRPDSANKFKVFGVPDVGTEPNEQVEVPKCWKDVPLDDVPLVPGMTQPDELRYFYWCCAARHRPGHRVVELGPYVGRSTMAMAAGVRRSLEPRAKVVTLDRFTWNQWALESTLGYTIEGLSPAQRSRLSAAQLAPKIDDSFLPFFEVYTEPLQDSIEVIDANLETFVWPGESIDVLMIDAAKCWDALDQIVRQFFPKLVDGAAVIHQDYKHFFTYWLHPVTEKMLERGVLTIAENVEGTPTQGFRFRSTPHFQVADFLHSAFDNKECDRLLARSARRFNGRQDRLAVAGARCQWHNHCRQPDRAKSVFRDAIRRGGFADNYALTDLLSLGGAEWARPLTALFRETLVGASDGPKQIAKIASGGPHTFVLPVDGGWRTRVAEAPAIDVTGAEELILNFHADESASDMARIRIQAANQGESTAFYDEESPLPPGGDVASVIPLDKRTTISLRLTTASEGSKTSVRNIECIAPLLLI